MSESALKEKLGKSKRYWDRFIKYVKAAHPKAVAEWKEYSTGARLVVRDRRRNLAYLKPDEKHFLVSLALGEKAIEALEESGLPARFVKSVIESPRYPEGRAARIAVDSEASLGIARKLLAIKAAH
jgi:hypothetical protein